MITVAPNTPSPFHDMTTAQVRSGLQRADGRHHTIWKRHGSAHPETIEARVISGMFAAEIERRGSL